MASTTTRKILNPARRLPVPEIVEPWGAYWIDDLECDACGRTWEHTGDPSNGPDPRQYVTLNAGPGPHGINLCPQCADEAADLIRAALAQDVPMGMQPEDTEEMCALPNDFYLYRSVEYLAELWWDEYEEPPVVRDGDGNKVPGNHDQYTFARAQRQNPSGPIRKDRR